MSPILERYRHLELGYSNPEYYVRDTINNQTLFFPDLRSAERYYQSQVDWTKSLERRGFYE